MVKETDEKLFRALRFLAPGTPLREGMENILRAKTGGLIVIGDSPQVLGLVEGGFLINCPYSSAALYELAKMDGAIVLNHDATRILYANTQLVPDASIPSSETGIRHRTAERVARQTGEIVISISQRRGIITIYLGTIRYSLRDIATILTKANQGLQTLEKYKVVIDKALVTLTALEFQELVTVFDVAKILQRIEMFSRMYLEMQQYICELGNEGRLVSMQLAELVDNVEERGRMAIEDYRTTENRAVSQIREEIRHSCQDTPDLIPIAKILGYGSGLGVLDMSVSPRGYRILSQIPRLPYAVVENLVATFGSLQNINRATIEELDEVEGIGEVRARAIREGLRRMREQVLLDGHL
ncbi:DNA integrity scanning protein DisA [Heliobacterium chlorum]|uniref:DNA integrity scanning protein DisA n=1 Tax=Heliobacterium chlorum TaxID=2698 RepID=A0ABR7T373_HELCL|nr:DNA integrity scanning diadenylate cyclase DisA [Heliobacterium chlorum]MBC9785223.1 DNA integrity scanning protein DisA [Heliobacterium chlorum]